MPARKFRDKPETVDTAIEHIVDSTIQWANRLDAVDVEDTFNFAVQHVKQYHYPSLNKEHIKKAREEVSRRLDEKRGYNGEVIMAEGD